MAKSRERRCVVSRAVLDEADLVRIAIGPDQNAIPDVAAKLPGRGVWVSANRASVDEAVTKNLIARSAKQTVRASVGLADEIEGLLVKRCLDAIGLARRSGDLVAGFDQVRSELRAAKPAWLLEAADGAADGRGKVLNLAKAAWDGAPIVGCFSGAELGAAVGRDHMTHGLVKTGGVSARLDVDLRRLGGFRPLVPADWSIGVVE